MQRSKVVVADVQPLELMEILKDLSVDELQTWVVTEVEGLEAGESCQGLLGHVTQIGKRGQVEVLQARGVHKCPVGQGREGVVTQREVFKLSESLKPECVGLMKGVMAEVEDLQGGETTKSIRGDV